MVNLANKQKLVNKSDFQSLIPSGCYLARRYTYSTSLYHHIGQITL